MTNTAGTSPWVAACYKAIDYAISGKDPCDAVAHLSEMEADRALHAALRRLSFAAQTTGGTAGRDDELIASIAQAGEALADEGSGGGGVDPDCDHCLGTGTTDDGEECTACSDSSLPPPDDTPPGNDALNESNVTVTRALTYLGYLLNSALCGGYEPHRNLYQYHQAVRSILVKLQEDEYYATPNRDALEALERIRHRWAAACDDHEPSLIEMRADCEAVRRALTAPPTVPEAVREALEDIARGPLQGPGDFGVYAQATAEKALAQHSEPGRGECGWSLDDEGYYQTECGTEFMSPDYLTLDEMPSMKYCPNCARRIRDDGAPAPDADEREEGNDL